jgi:hypothetical protein
MSLTKLFLEFLHFLEPSARKTLLRQKYSWPGRLNFPEAETFQRLISEIAGFPVDDGDHIVSNIFNSVSLQK